VNKATLGGGSSSTGNTTATTVTRDGTFMCKAGGNITVSCGYADGGGAQAMTYAVRAYVEYLGP